MLRERLKTSPEDGGVWTAKKVAAVMAAELGLAKVAKQRGWEALRAIGWTIQRPRPRHARAAGPEGQAEFKNLAQAVAEEAERHPGAVIEAFATDASTASA